MRMLGTSDIQDLEVIDIIRIFAEIKKEVLCLQVH